mmetsp:Transcript_44094/g.118940  ORF Transcript_44094/g.118940 Transcript_44094/m.118940 type:complete len:351 (-) Transcript_44094:137-1189(-)
METLHSLAAGGVLGEPLLEADGELIPHAEGLLQGAELVLQHAAHPPDVIQKHAHVHALGDPFEADAALDKILDVDATVPFVVQHLEDAASALDVDPHRHKVASNLRVPTLVAELLPGNHAVVVGVCLAEEGLDLPDETVHVVQLVHDGHLSVQLRQLRGTLHKDACHDVEDAKDNEYVEEEESHRIHPVDSRQGLEELVVIPAPGDALKDAQHRSRERAKELVENLDVVLGLRPAVDEALDVLTDDGDQEDAVDVHHKGQHHHDPQQGQHGIQDGVDHVPEHVEDPQHAKDLQDVDYAQQAQGPGVGQAASLRCNLDDASDHEKGIKGVPPPLLAKEEVAALDDGAPEAL